MNWKLPFWACLGAFAVCAGVGSAQEMKDTATGKTFPETVTLDYQGKALTLSGTGVSTRKKFFVKVYSVASYIEDPASVKQGDVFTNILDSKKAKQITMIFVRNVDQKRMQDGYRESLNKADIGKEFSSEIDKFTSFWDAVKTDDTYVVRWLPDGTVTVSLNGTEKGNIKNEKFAKALWSVWFGKDSVVNRNQLISQVK